MNYLLKAYRATGGELKNPSKKEIMDYLNQVLIDCSNGYTLYRDKFDGFTAYGELDYIATSFDEWIYIKLNEDIEFLIHKKEFEPNDDFYNCSENNYLSQCISSTIDEELKNILAKHKNHSNDARVKNMIKAFLRVRIKNMIEDRFGIDLPEDKEFFEWCISNSDNAYKLKEFVYEELLAGCDLI